MIEIALQYRNGVYAPATLAEQDKAAGAHKANQVVRGKLTEVRDARSLQQLRLYWVSCNTVADNSPDPKLNSKEAVDWHTRVSLRFIDPNRIAVVGEKIIVHVKSIAFENLKHLEMNQFMDGAIKLHADWLGVSKHEYEREIEQRGF